MTRMRRLDEAFERRDSLRISRRIPCTLLEGGRRHVAWVRDIAPGSLRVQTEAELRCGMDVVVSLQVPDDGVAVMKASVHERRRLARSLSAACLEDTVLRVDDPPGAWLRWVDGEIGRES